MSKKVFQISLFFITVLCFEGAMKPVGATTACDTMRKNCEAGKCEDAVKELTSDYYKDTLVSLCEAKKCDALADTAYRLNQCHNRR